RKTQAARPRARLPWPTMSLSSTAASAPNPWARILDALEKKINRHSYETWLKPTRFSHSKDGKLFVRVPTVEFRHIGEKYADLIQEAMDNLAMEFQDVEFVTPEEDPAPAAARPSAAPHGSMGRHDGGFGAAAAAAAPARGQARFDWDSAAQLNPRYTFESFVVGSGNQFAHAAAQAVAAAP